MPIDYPRKDNLFWLAVERTTERATTAQEQQTAKTDRHRRAMARWRRLARRLRLVLAAATCHQLSIEMWSLASRTVPRRMTWRGRRYEDIADMD